MRRIPASLSLATFALVVMASSAQPAAMRPAVFPAGTFAVNSQS